MSGLAQTAFPSLGEDARSLCRRTWWVFLIGGLAATVFGIAAFFQPAAAWFVVAVFFAADILVDGVANAVGALRNRGKDGWWILLLMGALGIAVGAFALLNPLLSMKAFVFVVAFQAIVFGALLVMLGSRLAAASGRPWVAYVVGALSIIFGVLILLNPQAGGLSVIRLIAAWALVTGLLRIAFAFHARRGD